MLRQPVSTPLQPVSTPLEHSRTGAQSLTPRGAALATPIVEHLLEAFNKVRAERIDHLNPLGLERLAARLSWHTCVQTVHVGSRQSASHASSNMLTKPQNLVSVTNTVSTPVSTPVFLSQHLMSQHLMSQHLMS